MVVPVIPIEEYMSTSYEPDCDFVDGVLEERNLGQWDHGRLQTLLAIYLGTREKQWGTLTSTEQRIQVSPTRVRVPDLCVVSNDAPREQVLTHPPMLCVEVLSPDDRWARVERRIDDFLVMGVPCVWVFDPSDLSVFECSRCGRRMVTEENLVLAGASVSINLPELFANVG